MIMKQITYSFVIPHHNTPDLLRRLLDSIPARDDLEIIIVDDNSDNDKKAHVERPDARTIFIDREHTKGAGHARNVGMDSAVGKWLLFADADDFYKPGFLDVLDEYKNEDIDVLFFDVDSADSATLKSDNGGRSWYQNMIIQNYDGTEESGLPILFFRYAPWCRMVSREFVTHFGIRFEEISIFNDSFFSIQTGYFARRWKVDKRKLYTVTYHEGSITFSRVTRRKMADSMTTYRRRAKFYSYIGHPEWNVKCPKGKYYQSCFKYVYKLLKRQPRAGFQAFFYYITHWYSIEKKSYYYVEIIEGIKAKLAGDLK